ncbi:MAG: tetratricopeptide repeat protein, partial [Roseiflexaceae bacterium]
MAELIELFARRSPDPHIQGDASNTLGWLYSKRGMLEPIRGTLELARGAYAAALRAYEPLPDTRWVVAEIRLELGLIQEHQGLAAQAVAMYRAVVEFLEKHPCEKLELVARHRLGHALLIQGRADLALVEIECALKLSRRLGADRTMQRVLGNRGRVYQVLGRFAEAESDQKEALASSRQLGERADIGHHLNHLAMILITRRKLDEGEPYIQEALDIARQLQDHESEQQCLGNLGLLYQARADKDASRRRERLDLALDCYQKAITIARYRKDWRHLGDHLLNEGNIYREIEQQSEAHACYKQAIALAKAYHADDTEWRIRYASGTLFMLQKQYAQAFEQYKRAITIVEHQR